MRPAPWYAAVMAATAEQVLQEFERLSPEDQERVERELLTRELQRIELRNSERELLRSLLRGMSLAGLASAFASALRTHPERARLSPDEPTAPRPLGLLRGRVRIADDFDAPLPDFVTADTALTDSLGIELIRAT